MLTFVLLRHHLRKHNAVQSAIQYQTTCNHQTIQNLEKNKIVIVDYQKVLDSCLKHRKMELTRNEE